MRAAVAQILLRGVTRLAARGSGRAPFSPCLDFQEKSLILLYNIFVTMQKNICSETILENPYFKVKIGTINKKNPTTFYVEGGTFITPVEEDGISYKEKMSLVYKEMAKGLHRIVSEKHLKHDFIANIDVADERMKVGKKTFFTFQYFLKQDGEPLPFIEISENGNEYIDIVLENIEHSLKENGFALSKTKN